MIKTFKDKETEKVWECELSRKIPYSICDRALKKLRWLDASQRLEDLRVPPSNHLEALKGDRKNQYSIRINDQYRICFIWQGTDAWEVEITDYHK